MTLNIARSIYPILRAEDWKLIFEALKVNMHLKKIRLNIWYVRRGHQSKILAYFMDLLRVNVFLEEIDLSDTPFSRNGSDEKVRALLQRNAALHKDALSGLLMTKPKVARVFLCGFPFAGKCFLSILICGVPYLC